MKERCSICQSKELHKPEVETAPYMWSVCPDCGAIYLWYEPQDYQEEFHRDPHMIKGLFGGYGSGKTTMAVAEILDHALNTPNGQAVMVAPTVKQLDQTVKKEFFRQCPDALISAYKVKEQEVVLSNGFSFLFYTSDDPVKIRSLNLTAFYIEEASGVSFEIFDVCKTRLRNQHAVIYKRDKKGEIVRDEEGKPFVEKSWHLGIVCSNPDINWIRSDVLLMSSAIYTTGEHHYRVENPIWYYSSHLIKTEQNRYLPPEFIPLLKANKPDWWIERYLNASFEYSEGLVYPMFIRSIVAPFPIPDFWLRLSATDFGGRAPHCTLMLAIDPKTNVVYVYDQYYKEGLSVKDHQEHIHELFNKVPAGRWLRPPLADPAGRNRDTANRKSLFEYFAEYGLYFTPANNNIDTGIMKVYTYLSMGKLKIFSSCVDVINEGTEYRYAEQKEGKAPNEKPIDGKDHAMDCLRYAISVLPDDPNDQPEIAGKWFVNASGKIAENQLVGELPFALQDDDFMKGGEGWY